MSRRPTAALLMALTAPLTDACVVLDQAGRILHLNPPAARYFARALETVRDQHLRVLNAKLADWFDANRASGNGVFTPTPNLDGQPTVSVAPLEAWGWMIVIARAERWKAQAIDSVVHDIKNPLNLATGAVFMLRETLSAPDALQAESLRLLDSGLERIGRLVERLLAIERVESPTALGEMTRLSLADVLQASAMRYVRQADAKAVGLLFERAPGDGLVLGDEEWLGSAADNLIENAIKYTPQGGQVRVIYRQTASEAIAEVIDSGPGIDPAAQTRLFEPFYRVDNEQARRIPGTGLGLAIVKAIIERHGGRVWVASAPGQGSTFGFGLPVSADREAGAPAPLPPDPR